MMRLHFPWVPLQARNTGAWQISEQFLATLRWYSSWCWPVFRPFTMMMTWSSWKRWRKGLEPSWSFGSFRWSEVSTADLNLFAVYESKAFIPGLHLEGVSSYRATHPLVNHSQRSAHGWCNIISSHSQRFAQQVWGGKYEMRWNEMKWAATIRYSVAASDAIVFWDHSMAVSCEDPETWEALELAKRCNQRNWDVVRASFSQYFRKRSSRHCCTKWPVKWPGRHESTEEMVLHTGKGLGEGLHIGQGVWTPMMFGCFL